MLGKPVIVHNGFHRYLVKCLDITQPDSQGTQLTPPLDLVLISIKIIKQIPKPESDKQERFNSNRACILTSSGFSSLNNAPMMVLE